MHYFTAYEIIIKRSLQECAISNSGRIEQSKI